MTELLLRIFIRKKINDPSAHASIGKLAGAVGIVLNILLFAGKLTAGLISGSLAIVADALNNLSDASSSLVTLLGFWMAQRPADKNHPYGHARYEYLSGFIIAALILFIGGELAISSVERIISPHAVSISALALAIMIASVAVKLWMALFYRKLGGRIGSTTLQAAAADSRNDVIATIAVLLGSLANRFWGINADGWLGLAVALFILYSGIGIARETISPLLGKQVDQDLLDGISSLILAHDGVLGIHDLLVHDYGPGRYFASVHVELSAAEDPQVCHDLIDDIECDAFRELNVNLVIHYDPVSVDDAELNAMRSLVEAIVREIDPQLSLHDFRMQRGGKRSRLIFDLAVPYSMADQHQQLKEEIDRRLIDIGKIYKTSIRFDNVE